jgi:DNA adenine methylase
MDKNKNKDKSKKANIKSALRYPGGKSRAIKYILPMIKKVSFTEYREPFIGGGSVFLAVKQNIKNINKFWINDINYDLYCFWKILKNKPDELYCAIIDIKNSWENGRDLYNYYMQDANYTEFERAVRFFVLNRITFSGTVDSGGYSEQAFKKRFTISSIERMKKMNSLLTDDVFITNYDYEKVIFKKTDDDKDGSNVFIFLDPPYFKSRKSRLYGKNGHLHQTFDHERFAKNMKKCKYKWLITYDDSPEIRELFDFANIEEYTLQYGMNNYKQKKAEKGKELFIFNYSIE